MVPLLQSLIPPYLTIVFRGHPHDTMSIDLLILFPGKHPCKKRLCHLYANPRCHEVAMSASDIEFPRKRYVTGLPQRMSM